MKFGFMSENRISGNGYRFNLNVFVKICQDLLRCISRIILDRSGRSRSSVKPVFLEIFQNSQENTCARVSILINKFIEIEALAQVFL